MRAPNFFAPSRSLHLLSLVLSGLRTPYLPQFSSKRLAFFIFWIPSSPRTLGCKLFRNPPTFAKHLTGSFDPLVLTLVSWIRKQIRRIDHRSRVQRRRKRRHPRARARRSSMASTKRYAEHAHLSRRTRSGPCSAFWLLGRVTAVTSGSSISCGVLHGVRCPR